MVLAGVGAFFGLCAALLALPILRSAFARSLGTGLMVLLVPVYVFWYAVGQFEHPRKPAIVCAWLASLGLAVVCFALLQAGQGPVSHAVR